MDEREQLKSSDPATRASAAEKLSLMGPDAAGAAVELVKACSDQELVREYAVAALEELGAPPTELLADLGELLRDDDPLVAYWAATLIGRAGAQGHFLQSSLASVLGSSSESSVKERVAWALGKIGADSEEAVSALEAAGESGEPRLARVAKSSLAQVGT